MKTLALIPARGGSTRIPHKNRRIFKGKPIMAYSIENAEKSGLFDAIVVSTDDFDIANIARDYGAQVWMRDYDDGTKGTQEVTADYLRSRDGLKYGIACCLYATAPLLTWRLLGESYAALIATRSMYAYTVHEDTKEDIGGLYMGWAQAFRDGYPLDGETAVARLGTPRDRCCDINDESDWQRAERMYESLNQRL